MAELGEQRAADFGAAVQGRVGAGYRDGGGRWLSRMFLATLRRALG